MPRDVYRSSGLGMHVVHEMFQHKGVVMASHSYTEHPSYVRSASSIASIRFGACEIFPRTREVFVNGCLCPMEPKVFDLLLYLIQERDRVVPKDELLQQIWKGMIVSESVIARTVMKARKAIGTSMPEGQFIKTMHCIGYRFVSAVEIHHNGDNAPPAAGGNAATVHKTQAGDIQYPSLIEPDR